MAISDSAQVDGCITFEVNVRLLLLFLQLAFSAFFVLLCVRVYAARASSRGADFSPQDRSDTVGLGIGEGHTSFHFARSCGLKPALLRLRPQAALCSLRFLSTALSKFM